MKLLYLAAIFQAMAHGSPLYVDAVPVSGGGIFSESAGDGCTVEGFIGEGVYVADAAYIPPSGIGYGSSHDSGGGWASIDGVGSRDFTFYIGGGAGELTLYDDGVIIAEASLAGWVQLGQKVWLDPNNTFTGFTQSFSIVNSDPTFQSASLNTNSAQVSDPSFVFVLLVLLPLIGNKREEF